MSVTIINNKLKVKDGNGNYIGIDAISDATTQEKIAAINAAGTTQINAITTQGETTRATIPSDYTTLSGDVAELKSALSDVEEVLPYYETEDDITNTLTWVDEKYIDVGSGNVITYSSLAYSVVGSVKTGEKYYFSGLRGIGGGRAITIISNSGIVNDHATVLAYEPENAGYFTDNYKIPIDGILVITTHSSTTASVIAHKFNKHYEETADKETVEKIVDFTEYISPNTELIDYDNLTSGYINGQGGINAASGTSQEKTSQVIPINTGHTYKFVCETPASVGTCWLAVGFWGADDSFKGRYSATVTNVGEMSHGEYTVTPKDDTAIANASYIRVSWRTYTDYMAEANDITFQGKTVQSVIEDDLSGKNKSYHISGGGIDVTRQGFDVVKLGFAPAEATGRYTQGMAVANGVIFQGFGDGSIDLIDLSTGAIINSYAASAGHAGSLSFASNYPDNNSVFPYLFVSSFNENKTFVYDVTRQSCTLLRTYIVPTETAGYCNQTCIDKVTGALWCIGHKLNSYETGGGLIVSAWDLADTTEDNGLLTPTNILHYELPWIPYLQAVQILNGQLFALFGADGSTAELLTHIIVLDLGMNTIKADIADLPSAIRSAEPEGIDFVFNTDTWKYDAIFATRRSVSYYRITF